MKRIKFITPIVLFFVALNFSSCVTTDEPVDPLVILNGSGSVGQFKVDFDGQTFVAGSVQAILNDDNLSITGIKPSGEFFQITLPEPEVGKYVWDDFDPSDSGFILAYSTGSGNVPYVGYRDDFGTFTSFTNYTDTAEIVISSIDLINKKISGTFKFTGVKFAQGSATTVETKAFTNGSFTNISFTGNVSTPTGNNFAAKLDGATYTAASVNAIKSTIGTTSLISISAVKGGVETISLSFPSNITPGTYNLSFSDYVGQYIKDASSTGSFVSDPGTLVIISHDVATKKIKGTFSFTAKPIIPPTTTTHEITQGSFNLTYL